MTKFLRYLPWLHALIAGREEAERKARYWRKACQQAIKRADNAESQVNDLKRQVDHMAYMATGRAVYGALPAPPPAPEPEAKESLVQLGARNPRRVRMQRMQEFYSQLDGTSTQPQQTLEEMSAELKQ